MQLSNMEALIKYFESLEARLAAQEARLEEQDKQLAELASRIEELEARPFIEEEPEEEVFEESEDELSDEFFLEEEPERREPEIFATPEPEPKPIAKDPEPEIFEEPKPEPAPEPEPAPKPEPVKPASVTDLKHAISLGDRFLFQRELFGQNGELMQKTLEALNNMPNIDGAIAYIDKHFNWDKESSTFELFLNALHRRFG